jgi:hypothetical protein
MLSTGRKRALGEIINLPDGPEQPSAPQPPGHVTKGYHWRIKTVESDDVQRIDARLVLSYERPHPETPVLGAWREGVFMRQRVLQTPGDGLAFRRRVCRRASSPGFIIRLLVVALRCTPGP